MSAELDELEEILLERTEIKLRHRISEVRKQATRLRRYLLPQKEALTEWINLTKQDETIKANAIEVLDGVRRSIEELESVKDRAAILQDEVMAQMSQKQSRSMFILAIFSLVFLPLSFITGLLGVNVSGIPMANDPAAFQALAVALLAVAAVEILVLWWAGWFRN